MLGRGCGRQTFLWQSEDSGWRAGEGLCGEKGSLLAPRNLHSWHIQLHWALQSLGIFFRLPLTPSSLELDFQGLISFHFLQGSGDFFLKASFFYSHQGYYSSTSVPNGNSKCRESLATAFSKGSMFPPGEVTGEQDRSGFDPPGTFLTQGRCSGRTQ